MADGTILPLIVNLERGGTVAALMNGKSYSKSIESKVLWIVHPETGRVLPWAGEPLYISLVREGSFYRSVLPEGTAREGYTLGKGDDDPELHGETALNSGRNEGSTILNRLADTVARRRKEMPAGSYTTHLFEKGLDKIRKKVGEEAVELILASSQEDILYESADLIYHLMVLLEAADVSFDDLLAELERRDS